MFLLYECYNPVIKSSLFLFLNNGKLDQNLLENKTNIKTKSFTQKLSFIKLVWLGFFAKCPVNYVRLDYFFYSKKEKGWQKSL